MTRDDIEEEASERHIRVREPSTFGGWFYENAVKVLMSIAIGAWGLAFAAWSTNVKDAKEAYVAGQQELTDALKVQQDLRERLVLVKDRQDRVIIVLDDLERRVRALEVGK
jgi:hypothetical protein